MKHFLVYFPFIFVGLVCKPAENPILFVRWVNAPSGLVVRAQPSATSSKVGAIPFAEPVAVFRDTGPEETIAGVKGRWLFVAYSPYKGYVFSGFLSSLPVPRGQASKVDDAVLARLSALSGISIPPMPIRERPSWATPAQYDPSKFSIAVRKASNHYVAISIQPDEHGCGWRGGYYDCFSILGTTTGSYILSDIGGPAIGAITHLDHGRAHFSNSEGHGDGCDFTGSGNSTLYIFSENRVLFSSFEGGGSCPCKCDVLAGTPCQCEMKSSYKTKYYSNGQEIPVSDELRRLFTFPES